MSMSPRQLLERGAGAPATGGNPDSAWKRGRARRRRQAVLVGTAALVSVVALASTAIVLSRSQGASPARVTIDPTWQTFRDSAHGLSIAYPADWHASPTTLTPVLADPIVPLAVGTGTMEPQVLGECDIVPQRALDAMRRDDAFVAVYLWQGAATHDPSVSRPEHFGPDAPWSRAPLQCTEHTVAEVQTLAFVDGTTQLSVLVAIGPDASASRRAEVYEILDTLRVG
jgi:hypothetical protein